MEFFFHQGIKKIGLNLDDITVNKLIKYGDLILETNKHTNLTAIRDKNSMYEKHFLDSLLLQDILPKKITKVIDIGTGAGFPGMVLAIINPNISFTLMDSVGKKTDFLKKVVKTLELSNVEIINSRAEDYIKIDNKRESYDLGVCRGVAKLNIILEYIIPFLKTEGIFLAQKMDYIEELIVSYDALDTLNSKLIKIYKLQLPYCHDKRYILEIKKTDKSDSKYPRRAGVSMKRPL